MKQTALIVLFCEYQSLFNIIYVIEHYLNVIFQE